MRRFIASLLVLAIPSPALACPVCGLASTLDNRGAYIGMTLVLSGVPLAMIAGITIWIARRARRQP
jgi:hypothetical protein